MIKLQKNALDNLESRWHFITTINIFIFFFYYPEVFVCGSSNIKRWLVIENNISRTDGLLSFQKSNRVSAEQPSSSPFIAKT